MARLEQRCPKVKSAVELGIAIGGCAAGAYAVLRGEFVQVIALIVPAGWIPTGSGAAGAEIVRAIQVPLADVGGANAVVMQTLADRVHGLTQRQAIGPGAIRVRISAGEDRRASRRADRLASIGSVEADAACGDSIQVWSLKTGLAIAVQHVGPHGIGHQQHGLARSGTHGLGSRARGSQHSHEITAIHR